ncbi:MAG: MATE family efflux transporter [Deltaproteobacteria bacterium]|nr:MATE family efflux transporter [Deltaproteobacteria bacterium]
MSSGVESSERSLAWSNQPFRELVRLAWPITVSFLSFGVMTFVDTLFVSSIGTAALAGVGLAGVATFALYCFSMGLLRGVKVLASQAIGAGRRGDLGSYLGAGLATAGVLGLLTILVGELVAQFLPLLAASDAAGEAALTYLRLRVLGAPMILAFVAIRELRYGESDTRSPMIAGLAGNAVNIAFNYLFVIVLHWGVRGSAIATLIGHGIELAIVVYAQSRVGFSLRGTKLSHVRELIEVGVPTGVQFLLEMGSFSLLTVIVSTMGEVQMAAHHIAIQVIHFSFLPTVALAEAGSVLAGQAVGAGQDHLVKRVARSALAASSIYTGAWTIGLLAFGPLLVSVFTDEAELSAVALVLLYVAALFQIADGAATVARGVLRGAGDAKVPAQLGVVCAWLFTPPLAWALGRGLGLGALGGWIGLSLEILSLALLCWWRLEREHWRPMARASRERLSLSALRDADDVGSASISYSG